VEYIGYNRLMPSKDEKQALQQQYFNKVKLNNKEQWSLCYICSKPRYTFTTVENISMPVCEEHS
jgi:hypothetical protein